MRKRITEKFILSSEDVVTNAEAVENPSRLDTALEKAIGKFQNFINSKQQNHEVQETTQTSTR